jgi:hypothetical protein
VSYDIRLIGSRRPRRAAVRGRKDEGVRSMINRKLLKINPFNIKAIPGRAANPSRTDSISRSQYQALGGTIRVDALDAAASAVMSRATGGRAPFPSELAG